MANIKVAITSRKAAKDRIAQTLSTTVLLQESEIVEVLPSGTGSQIRLSNGTEYISAQTVTAVGTGIGTTTVA